MEFFKENNNQEAQPQKADSPVDTAREFNKKNKAEQQKFRLNYILSQASNELKKIKEYLILQQQIENKHSQMLKDKSKKDEWEKAKNNMEFIFHINEIINADFDFEKINNPEINQDEINFVREIYELKLGALNKKERQKIILEIQTKLDKRAKELDKLEPKPRLYATTEMKKARSSGYYPSELVGDHEDALHQAEYIEKNDNKRGKHGQGKLEDVADKDTMNFENKTLAEIDKNIVKEKRQINKKILNFIEKNEHKFNQYQEYFVAQQAYLKDKKMLEAKLAANQNINNPRQRVNAEAIQEELTQMENRFTALKSRLNIDQLPMTEKLLKGIVYMSTEELTEFKNNLIKKTTGKKVISDKEQLERIEAA